MQNTTENKYSFKVVLLGEGCVGKTSLVLRYVEDKFNKKHITTLQASFLTKKINYNGNRIHLNIWDTAGQERFHALGPIYYRSSNGAILVYDVTDEGSFQKVKNWVRELKMMLGADIVLAIAGNKIDLQKDIIVPLETAESYAESVGAKHFETSAKNNIGVEELFLELTNMMIASHDAKQTENTDSRTNSLRRSNRLVVADSSDMAENNSSRCCGNG